MSRNLTTVRAENMLENCMLKYCLPLTTFIPNFVVFIDLLGTVSFCIWKISSSVTTGDKTATFQSPIQGNSISIEQNVSIQKNLNVAISKNGCDFQHCRHMAFPKETSEIVL